MHLGRSRMPTSCRRLHVLLHACHDIIRKQQVRQRQARIGRFQPSRQSGGWPSDTDCNLVEVFPIRFRRRVQAIEQIGAFGFVEEFQCAHAAIW